MKCLKSGVIGPKRKIVKILKIGLVIFGIFFFLEIWMVNRLPTYGDKIQQLKEAKTALQLENRVLENTISENVALGLVEKRANRLGFETVKNLEYVKSLSLASIQ